MYVLGIESSCDETGLAIYHSERGLIGSVLHSQVKMHQKYGGVVPELASRDHIQRLVPLLDEVLKQADIDQSSLDLIAYTAGPGLIGALLTGASFAKSLALGLAKPSLAVHHLEAHVLAAQLDFPELTFPFLALLISGGHTQLIQANSLGNYQLIGESVDDAVGEAFDKTARLMGLPYPGGASLAKLADRAATFPTLPYFSPFPRPMTDKPTLNFSFSGLKTHAMITWNDSEQNEAAQIAIAQAFQEAVIDTLTIKCKNAIKQTQNIRLVVGGGVAANQALRKKLVQLMDDLNGKVYFPRPEYCTDNGAMIAYAGYRNFIAGAFDNDHGIHVKARWAFE